MLTGLAGAAAAPVFFFCSLGGACGSALGTELCTGITNTQTAEAPR